MKRAVLTKMQVLEARHPGICQKVHAMFDECYPPPAVKKMIETQYGERISLTTVEKYKREHWRMRHERLQQAGGALAGASGGREIRRSGHRNVAPALHRVTWPLIRPAFDARNELKIGPGDEKNFALSS